MYRMTPHLSHRVHSPLLRSTGLDEDVFSWLAAVTGSGRMPVLVFTEIGPDTKLASSARQTRGEGGAVPRGLALLVSEVGLDR